MTYRLGLDLNLLYFYSLDVTVDICIHGNEMVTWRWMLTMKKVEKIKIMSTKKKGKSSICRMIDHFLNLNMSFLHFVSE